MERSVKFSFTSGEFSEELYGRSDLERYDFGSKLQLNAPSHYGGGAFKRRGLLLKEFIREPEARMIPFQFGDDPSDSYILVFQSTYILVFQENGFLTEATKTVSGVSGNVLTVTGHGYTTGNLVYIPGFTDIFRVTVVDPNTISLLTFQGIARNLAGATQSRKLISIAHPYTPAAFRTISYQQVFDVVRLTHPDYPEQLLQRTDSGWTLTPAVRAGGAPISGTVTVATQGTFIKNILVKAEGSSYDSNTQITLSGGGGSGFLGEAIVDAGKIKSVSIVNAGKGYTSTPTVNTPGSGGGTGADFRVVRPERDAGFVVTVTAIYADGNESGPMRPTVFRAALDFTQVRGEAEYSWPAVAGAVSYNVYRSAVYPDGKDIHIGLPLGFIGNTRARSFTDTNIAPDFGRAPEVFRDPFTPKRIDNVTVVSGGSGYSDTATISVTGGGGSGAVLWPIIKSGEVIGAYIANHGTGYTSAPTLTVSGGGSGANLTAVISADRGTLFPGCSFTFQQRVGYAGSHGEPMTVYGSKVGDFDNFSRPLQVAPDDSFEYTIDGKRQSRIRHAVPGQLGLLLFTASSIALLRAADGASVGPTGARLDPQSFLGSSELSPVLIGNDIFYVQDKFQSMRMLELEAGVTRYRDVEISTLAPHIFENKTIIAMTATSTKERHAYGIYSDGTGFMLTFDKEQSIFAFSRITTRGQFLDVITLSEGTREKVYFLVRRYVGTAAYISLEVMNQEESLEPEDAVYMDAVLRTSKTRYGTGVTITIEAPDRYRVRSEIPVFSPIYVGYLFGAGGMRGYVSSYVDGQTIYVEPTRGFTVLAPEGGEPYRFTGDEWYMNQLRTTFTGIPYEGATVSVVADGKQLEDKVVSNGAITLEIEAGLVQVGFRYRCKIVTLDVSIPEDKLEGKLVTIPEARVKFRRAGAFRVNGRPVIRRSNEAWNEPTNLQQEPVEVTLSDGFTPRGEMTIECDLGLPLEILQVAFKIYASA